MGVTVDEPTVVAVVVTFEATAHLERCLAALADVGGVTHTVVVDNGGRAQVEDRDDVTLIRPTVNRGFGAGANVGFAAARDHGAHVVVLLNDDVVVAEGWLTALTNSLFAATDVGAVQPMLVLAGTDPTQVNSLGVDIGTDGAGVDIGLGTPASDVATEPHEISVFTGGAVAFRPQFLDATGGFDERYFLYYEDVDLARRGSRFGWRYRCVPQSVVEHAKGASSDALGDRTVYLRERNRLWSAFRNESARTVVGALWLSVRRLRHQPRAVHARALGAGVAGGAVRLVERWRAG